MQMTDKRYIKFPGLCGQRCLFFSDRFPFVVLLVALLTVICSFMSVILRPAADRHRRRGVQNILRIISRLLGTSQGRKRSKKSALAFFFRK